METVERVKRKLQDVPPEDQKLSFGGMRLENSKKIWCYGIKEGSSLNLSSKYFDPDDESRALLGNEKDSGCCVGCLIL